MRAFVLHGPADFSVDEVPDPSALAGEAIVEVERVGVCGTDMEFYTGEMAYLHQGYATYPMRLGHEWCGTVRMVGPGVDESLIGRRVMGDTMLGCGVCRRCRRGHQHVCDNRGEVGVRDGRPGALAELISAPINSLHSLPTAIDEELGALIEPGGNAYRAAEAANVANGDRVLVLGPGAIGSLVALFLRAAGCEVHLLGRSNRSLEFVRGLGFQSTWTQENLPDLPFDSVVDASNATHLPALALDLVEPAGRLVYVGLAGSPSLIDTRNLALKDVTAVGVLSASPGIDATINAFATGQVDPRPLIAATVGLDEVGSVLAGQRPDGSTPGPKILVDPRR
jgi:threonine dehydrogenase-like Zn-dependent dehydrogenase